MVDIVDLLPTEKDPGVARENERLIAMFTAKGIPDNELALIRRIADEGNPIAPLLDTPPEIPEIIQISDIPLSPEYINKILAHLGPAERENVSKLIEIIIQAPKPNIPSEEGPQQNGFSSLSLDYHFPQYVLDDYHVVDPLVRIVREVTDLSRDGKGMHPIGAYTRDDQLFYLSGGVRFRDERVWKLIKGYFDITFQGDSAPIFSGAGRLGNTLMGIRDIGEQFILWLEGITGNCTLQAQDMRICM